MREKPGKRPQKPTISLRKPAISASGFLAERIIQRFPNTPSTAEPVDEMHAASESDSDALNEPLHATPPDAVPAAAQEASIADTASTEHIEHAAPTNHSADPIHPEDDHAA